MKGLVNIKGVGKDNKVLLMTWETKGKKKKGYRITKFKMYLDVAENFDLPSVTKNKLELYMSELNTLWKLKRIKTELDLEIFTNKFARENGVGFLFNGKRHFAYEHISNEQTVKTNGLLVINDTYYKKRYSVAKKQMMKEKQRK